MRREVFFALQAAFLLLVVFSLYLGHDQLSQISPSFLKPNHWIHVNGTQASVSAIPSPTAATNATTTIANPTATTPADNVPIPTVLSAANRTAYVAAIMNPDEKNLPRLECPTFNPSRYEYLAVQDDEGEADVSGIQYFFALDLRECLHLLPRLIGSIVEAIRFLGPQSCALSIIEGNSHDGTAEVLAALRPELDALTTTYYFKSSDINPKQGDRITKLAELRNLALQPMLDPNNSKLYPAEANTTVIFLNDVAACTDDILELVHQRRFLGADMTCAMDWTYAGQDPTFYDVWIARTLAGGDSFFDIPADGNWNSAWNIFWNEPTARERYLAHQPFQVFSCWNGATAFTAKPFLEKKVTFRAPRNGECMQGEPQLLCKDFWWHGYGKIAVVPTVNLEYSDEKGKKIKEAKGFTSHLVGAEGHRDDAIQWQASPPEKVKCMPDYAHQFFEEWNKTQPGL
ncbi:cryptococcal mannosyltransferase 1 domain-containing protein [Neurospora intermedia]|uniref:Cryptococcal mannosyltransferase 1 domain-containing protein n=1 Tax=Neurospora intermedia TaxID=5142 RepID=A0ABR3D4H4_NEUIN